MTDNILDSVKDEIGGGAVHQHFDQSIINAINTAILELRQIGIGPEQGFVIITGNETWSDYLGEDNMLMGSVPQLVALKSRMLFDPPSGGLADQINKQIAEIEWRLNMVYELGV